MPERFLDAAVPTERLQFLVINRTKMGLHHARQLRKEMCFPSFPSSNAQKPKCVLSSRQKNPSNNSLRRSQNTLTHSFDCTLILKFQLMCTFMAAIHAVYTRGSMFRLRLNNVFETSEEFPRSVRRGAQVLQRRSL